MAEAIAMIVESIFIVPLDRNNTQAWVGVAMNDRSFAYPFLSNQAFFGMAEAIAMLSECRSIEGDRLTLISRLKQHISSSRRGLESTVISSLELLSLQILSYLLNEAFFSKSTNQNAREYRLHLVDIENASS